MGRVDIETKKYMQNNSHFADAFNYYLYNGKPVIDAEALREIDTTEIVLPFGNGAREPQQKTRDVLKLWAAMQDENACYAILGIENQANIHYAMPVRNGLYDFANYAKQVEEAAKSFRRSKAALKSEEFLSGFRKEDRLLPVISLIIYFGASEWDGPMSIHEMLDIRRAELLPFIPDYRINLLAPANIPDEDFTKFHTDLGKVMEYIKLSTDKSRLNKLENDRRYSAVDKDSFVLINLLTNSKLKARAKGGKVDMCVAIKEMRAESRKEGEDLLGKLITILSSLGRNDDILLVAKDPEYRKQLYQEFQID